jgi:HK97 family phage major capsid protein
MAEKLSENDAEKLLGILTEIKTTHAAIQADHVKFGKADSETLVKLDKVNEDMLALHKKYDDGEKQREALARQITDRREAEQPKSFGERIIEDEGLKTFLKNGARGAYVVTLKGWNTKDIVGLSTVMPQQLNVWAGGPRLPFGVRQLIPQGRTTAGAVEYMRETAFANNADVVAEGAQKPKSDKEFAAVESTIRTIAHIFKVSRQSYEDLPGLGSQIEANGVYGVQLKEDQQFINGTGATPQLEGLMKVATAAPVAPAPPAGIPANNLIDALGTAVFDLATKGYLADGSVVNPANWGTVAMIKNQQGNYMFANPMEYAPNMRVWGTTLAMSANMAAGNFLTGAFRGNSLILDREEVNAVVAEQNVDDFEKNMLTVRVEERVGLLIYTAAAFEKGVVPAAAVTGGNNEEGGRRR